MPEAIELHGLTKDYGKLRALEDVTLSVAAGEIFGFLGPNGAGKTTTIRMLFDLIRPTRGHAIVHGFDCQRQSVQARAHLGYLPGELHLYDNLTGRETIDLFKTLADGRVEEAFVAEVADRLDFDPSRVARTYSKGNRQKLGLILAMMSKPDVLVLDEPTSGLDPLVQSTVEDILRTFASEGHTVFLSSHVLSEVERLCDRAAFLRQGRLIAVEEVGAVKGRSLHFIEVTFASPVDASEFDIDGAEVVESYGETLRIQVRSGLDAVLKQIARHEVVDLRTEQPSLEDVFRVHYQVADAEDGGEAA